MKKIAIVFVIFFSVTVFDECQGHSDGAPVEQCEQMTPNHGSSPQTGASPYEIKVTKTYYVPGENVGVSIESSSDNIKGYLIQARSVGENSAIGTFAVIPANGEYVNCSNSKGAITHSDKLAVKTINFDWVPPSNLSGNVSFYATVVKDYSTFWVKLQSPELYKREMQPTVQGNSTSKSMTNPATEPTSTANSTCKPGGNPKCDGAQTKHSILTLFFSSLFVALWQTVIET